MSHSSSKAKRFFLFSLLSLHFISNLAYGKSSLSKNVFPIGLSDNLYKVAYQYKKVHATFSKKFCSSGEDQAYSKLLKNYRGGGFYLPLLGSKVDKMAIRKNLDQIRRKLLYIARTQKKLKQQKKLPRYKDLTSELTETLNQLLLLKKEYDLEKEKKKSDPSKIENIQKKSKATLKSFAQAFNGFMGQLYFLKSYNFPNDHLNSRSQYEDAKFIKNKHESNRIYFYRKIVEDGTYLKNHTYPDIYLRSTLDTLAIAINKNAQDKKRLFIDEDIRYDLAWSLKRVEKVLKNGQKVALERLDEWYKRTAESYSFYKDIIRSKNKSLAQKIINEKNTAMINLKSFVYKKQAEVYKWWLKQSELMRSIYVMETILFNEVGGVDGPDGLERKDVALIVLNRVKNNKYNQLTPGQPLTDYLDLKLKDLQKNRWLNTLFKVGEFSFTYFYISSVVKIFCPDMSMAGKKLRAQNVKISLKAMKNYNTDFKALRYFSRISMLGKIDMTSVWYDYTPYPERAGPLLRSSKELEMKVNKDDYTYLYSFDDPKGDSYKVIMIDDEIIVISKHRRELKFYKYRDPNLFRYFIKQ